MTQTLMPNENQIRVIRTEKGLAIFFENDSARKVVLELTELTAGCILEPLFAFVYDLEHDDEPQHMCFGQETLPF